MNRTPLRSHVFAEQPSARVVFALISTAVLIYVGVTVGPAAFGVSFVLLVAGLLVYGIVFRKRQLRKVEEDRAACVKRYSGAQSERMLFARRNGMEYEAVSERLAEGFGRVVQEIPENLEEIESRLVREQQVGIMQSAREAQQLPWARVVARHAAALTAQSIVRMELNGFSVTVFDLERIDDVDGAELLKYFKPERAAEAAKDYLTVWVLTLPLPLPYLSSAYAWMSRERESDLGLLSAEDRRLYKQEKVDALTENAEFADLLLSVPAVRTSALSQNAAPWTVDGSRLLACCHTNDGVTPEALRAVAAELSEAAGQFPWPDLERFRVDPARDQLPGGTPLRWTYRSDGPVVEWWEETQVTRSGLRAFTCTGSGSWSRIGGMWLWDGDFTSRRTGSGSGFGPVAQP